MDQLISHSLAWTTILLMAVGIWASVIAFKSIIKFGGRYIVTYPAGLFLALAIGYLAHVINQVAVAMDYI